MEDVVWKGVGDVRLKLNGRVCFKRVPPFPIPKN